MAMGMFGYGARVTPIGWLLGTPKPVGEVRGEYRDPLTNQWRVIVKWDDIDDYDDEWFISKCQVSNCDEDSEDGGPLH